MKPTSPTAEKRTVRVVILLTPAEYAKAEADAKAASLPPSVYLRTRAIGKGGA